jgi:hypothetical protein
MGLPRRQPAWTGVFSALPAPVLADGRGGGVFSPGLATLRSAIQREQSECLLLVLLAALLSMPTAYISVNLLSVVISAVFMDTRQSTPSANPLVMLPALIGIAYSLLLTFSGPLLVLGLALWNYSRQYKQVAGDLVCGPLALLILDEAIGREVEEAQKERWRPNINRVELGSNLVGRLNHAAHYYAQYWRLARDRREPLPVYKTDRNCWLDGVLVATGGACCGALLILEFIRIASLYPASLAFKRAVYEYLAGSFDAWLAGGQGAP